jgi:serine/threonine protein kinase
MPAPTTIDEFLDLVRKSGVVEDKRLAAHLDKLRAGGQMPPDPLRLAQQLVRDGVLTHFQAEQFLQGKWRRFTIGKYKVLERLGSGGMGSVYLCEHLLMRRRVAVKVLPAAKAEDSSSLERFYREARAVAALDHPNIVRAYDIDQDDNLHFLVMEHVDGSSLQEIIKRTGTMDVLRAAHYIRQAALGLQHAHETAALVHRDIKPGNILVDRNGIVKVLDMGLARFFHDEEDVLTKKYDENVLGTADYLAPEQAISSHDVDIRADIYSLGATFYFCLTGRTPFAEGSVAQKLIWHQTRAPKPLRSFRPEVPEGIVAVIDRMMAKDVGQRYQSPQEVADALEPWTQTPIPPPPDNEMPQFSLAATRPLVEVSGNSLTTRQPVDLSPPPRKVWQVSGSSVQSMAATTAPSSTRPISPPPARESRSATMPSPAPAAPPPSPAPVARATAPAPVAPQSPAPAPIARSEARAQAQVAVTAPAGAGSNGARNVAIQEKPAVSLPDATEEIAEEEEDPFTTRRSRSAPSRRKPAPSVKPGPLLWIILGVSVLVALPLLGFAIYLLVRSPEPAKPVAPPERKPIIVDAFSRGGLAAALSSAKPGDHILLEVDIYQVNLSVKTRDITIEGAPGKKVVWRGPTKVPDKSQLLIIDHAPGVTLKGITLDGENKTETLLMVYGKCPGVKLENLQMRNARSVGLVFANCEGAAENPVQLTDVDIATTTPTTTAIRFMAFDHHPTIRKNRFISLTKCTFSGPGQKLTAPNDAAFDLATIKGLGPEKIVIVP